MLKKICLLLISFFIEGKAQEIATIQLKPIGSQEQLSIVPLGTVLELSFDDLKSNQDYQYKIELMTYDWKPSELTPNNYIDGFEQDNILNISNSFNTLQNYTHYSVQIPNENTKITKTGNYLISVLDEDDNIVFSRRCVFYRNYTDVGVRVSPTRLSFSKKEKQNVQVIVNHKKFRINNPNQEVKLAIIQNNNWKSIQYTKNTQFIRTNQLVYSYLNKNNFIAGNEFRIFDNKRIRYTNMNIAKSEMKELFHNYLFVDEPRRDLPYNYNPDANGQFIIRTLDGQNTDLDADYAIIHFALNDYYRDNRDVYIVGQFNNYSLEDTYKMTYEDGHYIANLKLKQGAYNYQYVVKDKNKNVDIGAVDGSFYSTDNEYTALIYFKENGGLYDQVIGVGRGYVKN